MSDINILLNFIITVSCQTLDIIGFIFIYLKNNISLGGMYLENTFIYNINNIINILFVVYTKAL